MFEEIRKSLPLSSSEGVGKSKLGVQLAQSLNGEVINADAMQMYQVKYLFIFLDQRFHFFYAGIGYCD